MSSMTNGPSVPTTGSPAVDAWWSLLSPSWSWSRSGSAFAGGSMATGDKEATETVVVCAGRDLVEIASGVADDGDVRDMMSHISDLNQLDSVALAAGQRLEVPVD